MRNDLKSLLVLMTRSLDSLAPEDRVKAVARRIAHEAPTLADLDTETLERVARAVVAETLKDDLKRKVNLEKIDAKSEEARFLLSVEQRTGSKHTPRAYAASLKLLEHFCSRRKITVLELTPAMADDWIGELLTEGRSPATVRLETAAASSFFTWLERRHESIRNPFRGTRARPVIKPRRKLAVPTESEIGALEAEADSKLRAAIVLMTQTGLRVGALPGVSITGNRLATTTKGKDFNSMVPKVAREAIMQAGLPLRSPFAGITSPRLADRFRYLSRRLYKAGRIFDCYSVHDLRHSFAVRLYQHTHDIYQVSKALGHATVAVTERYLRSIGLTA